MAKNHIVDYTVVAASNTDVDGVDTGEGCAPSTVNDAMREIMADMAEYYQDVGGGISSTGAAGVYALTTKDGVAAYAQGQIYAFEANHACTGAATLNINAIGAKAIKKYVSEDLIADDIIANQICLVCYEQTNDVFHLLSVNAYDINAAIGNNQADVITTRGDVIRGSAGSAAERLAVGTAGQTLGTDGTDAAWKDRITADTVQDTSTAGTVYDFTGIPAWVKRVVVLFDGVSLSGTDDILIQIGDAGGFETSGYVSRSGILRDTAASGVSDETAGFVLRVKLAGAAISGRMTIENITGNVWIASHAVAHNATRTCHGGGTKTLTGTLTQVRLTRDGTDTFDAGQINIFYE